MKLKYLIPIIPLLIIGIFIYAFIQDTSTSEEFTELSQYDYATFSAGWFWGVESGFEKYIGVIDAVSGFTEVESETPVYELVSLESEAVRVYYDPRILSYENVLTIYWDYLNPDDDYTTCYAKVFYETEIEKDRAELYFSDKSKDVKILSATGFHIAEDEHQDYYHTEPTIDFHETLGNGWNKEAKIAMLTKLQRQVTQEEGTEPPFDNAYWDNKESGIYVDIVSGEALFSSTHKYKSGTGWPSFYDILEPDNFQLLDDNKLFTIRTEVRSKLGDSHLGHLFNDGPEPTGLRYCMNSASLRFIPVEDMANEGYGVYLYLFKN